MNEQFDAHAIDFNLVFSETKLTSKSFEKNCKENGND